MRFVAYTRPPKRPMQIVGYVGVSMGAPSVATLLHGVIDPKTTISESLGTREEGTRWCSANTGEPIARR